MSLRDYFEQRAQDGSWASLYRGPPDARTYNFLTRRDAVLRLLAADGAFPRILDVGCGTGDYAEVAARHGGVYHGIDFAPTMVREAQRTTNGSGERAASTARFAVADGQALPFAADAFDLVLGLGYIAYFADPRPAIGELRRVLRPGGTLVLQVAKPDLFGWLDRVLFERRQRRRAQEALPDGWVNVQYSGHALDRLLAAAGFRRTDRTFNHVHAMPGFLRRRHPQRAIRMSEALTRGRGSWWWRALAVNYIGKYVLAK